MAAAIVPSLERPNLVLPIPRLLETSITALQLATLPIISAEEACITSGRGGVSSALLVCQIAVALLPLLETLTSGMLESSPAGERLIGVAQDAELP
jgi:hypothetical protein